MNLNSILKYSLITAFTIFYIATLTILALFNNMDLLKEYGRTLGLIACFATLIILIVFPLSACLED